MDIHKDKCEAPECTSPILCKRLCSKHYARFRRTGTLVKQVGNYKHGMKNTPEYNSWLAMKQRCSYKGSRRYANYGGRGIKVCERWQHSFINFYNDLGPKPTPQHSIDRIDGEGNYELSNCRWATQSEQAANKRVYANNKSGVAGVSLRSGSNKWVANINRNGKRHYLGQYDTKEEAISARARAMTGME